MCSSNVKVSAITDPGNFFGKRPGGMDYGAMIDPGGNAVEKITGSDKARRIADPAKVIPDSPVVEEAYEPMTEQERQARTTTSISANQQRPATSRTQRFYGSM